MKMANYVFPDPNDRSKNNPCVILSNKKVLGIYNQEHKNEDNMRKVTQKVQEWIKKEAESLGWNEVKFAGGQCILEYNFESKDIREESN